MALKIRPKQTKPDWHDDLATDAQHAKLRRSVAAHYMISTRQVTPYLMETLVKNALGSEPFCLNTLTKEQIGKVFQHLAV